MRTREEAEKLFNDNIRIAYFMHNKHKGLFQHLGEVDADDALQVCLLGLWFSALKYDPARCPRFVTYACKNIFYELVNARRTVRRHEKLPTLSLFAATASTADGAEALEGENIPDGGDMEGEACSRLSFERFVETLEPEPRRTLELYARGTPVREIARIRGVSQPAVTLMIQRTARKYAGKYDFNH